MIKHLTSFAILLLLHCAASAQVPVVNDGAVIKIDNQVVMVDGNIFHQNNGTITNSGDIYLTGNWTNNNPASTIFAPLQPGWTHLIGANQNITGTRQTQFNKLALSGGGIKFLDDISTLIEDTLALNDREFAADTNTVFVLGTGTGLITRTTGFVSSISNGGLSRNTLASASYLYPVGSSTGTLRYRPVEITPGASAANTFKVRMANVDATAEGFNRTTIDTILCNINPLFYHRIFHTAGSSPADLTIYYDAASDGSFQTIGHWQNQPRWESTGGPLPSNSASPLTGLTLSGWTDYSYTPFGLANIAPIASLSSVTVCENDSATLTASGGFSNYDFYVNGSLAQSGSDSTFSFAGFSNGDVVNVVPSNTNTCPGYSNYATVTVNPLPAITISGPTIVNLGETVVLTASGAQTYVWTPQNTTGENTSVTPTTMTSYTVQGTNSNGCSDTASVTILVGSECGEVFVPTAFSPNGDAHNDLECVLGHCVRNMYFAIYDRWGEKVFESTDREICWDGTFRGKELNSAVFVYYLTAELITGKTVTQKGNISLIR